MKGRDSFDALISAYEALAIAFGDRTRQYRDQTERMVLLEAERDELQAQLDELRAQLAEVRAQEAELSGNSGQLPAEPAREPHRWQLRDEIRSNDKECRKVVGVKRGLVKLLGFGQLLTQPQWERLGWKLHRKASDKPDSTGTDGEGQP